MDWNGWLGKKVFLRTKNNRNYSGIITAIDMETKPLIFISMLDKYDKIVLFVHSEIVEIKEEM